jgi:geranylgeranyl pyrophosphate synthase
VDDILDATSEVEALGKTPGKDKKLGKITYTGLYGLTEARAMARALSKSIYEDFETLGAERNW